VLKNKIHKKKFFDRMKLKPFMLVRIQIIKLHVLVKKAPNRTLLALGLLIKQKITF